MRTVRQSMVALFAVLLLSACAGDRGRALTIEQRMASQGFAIKDPVSETRGKVLSWGYINNTYLFIYSGANNTYLLTLKSPSVELSSAANIRFTTHFNSLTDQDKVIVSSPSGVSRSFQIGSLHRLEKLAGDVDRP